MFLKKYSLFNLCLLGFVGLFCQDRVIPIPGLEKEVEILVDQWGIPHIYAQTESDLFFAQGFYAAQDRLFQFEIWRRQATGTVAEILGERELKRDIGTRLFKFRANLEAELNHYHPRGGQIIESFVNGVNAYIEKTEEDPKLLPPEFDLLGIKPQKWTPEIVISRHQGLLGNIGQELKIARAVVQLGADHVKKLSYFHPEEPKLDLDPKIDPDILSEDILELYNAFRQPVRFLPEDLVASVRNPDKAEFKYLANLDAKAQSESNRTDLWDIGSNNWMVSGEHTQSAYPIMANDPHRTQSVPSLRYMSHLVGPGWNVIGGGEPEIPGISIGHNEFGAWGLTVFRTDAEDLYIYKTNPDNPNQYWYQGAWEEMRVIREQILVKGSKNPVEVTLKYSRHGPVLYENPDKHTAAALRCGWMEIGGSPYLASLRMDQAKNWEEFRQACNFSNIPGENMIWADREGNIAWQAVGIAPIRNNWSGLVPVPGDGSYEWDGYLPIIAKPNILNPAVGFFATANENVVPETYSYMNAIGFSWSDPFRGDRVREFLSSGRKFTLMDMAALQTDYLSLPARTLVPLLKNLQSEEEASQKALDYLHDWDFQLNPNSVPAGIYNEWEQQLKLAMTELLVPEEARPNLSLQFYKIVEWLVLPDNKFGDKPVEGRNKFLLTCLKKAIQKLESQLGTDWSKWQYGQLNYKHIYLKHPLSNAVNKTWRDKLNVGPAIRGGNSYTVNNTTSNNNQSSGASFRIIVDTKDWDHCLGTNSPGQSGDPKDKHYQNLFDIWANNQYFPVFFSRKKIEAVKDETWTLQPDKN